MVCAFTPGATGGEQNPDLDLYLCVPDVHKPGCEVGPCNALTGNILHELMHVCGSGQDGGFPDSDPAQNRAKCLCAYMSTSIR